MNLRTTTPAQEEIYKIISQVEKNSLSDHKYKTAIDYEHFRKYLQGYSKSQSYNNPNHEAMNCLIKAANTNYQHKLVNDNYWKDVTTGMFDGALIGSTVSFIFLAIASGLPCGACISSTGQYLMGAATLVAGGIGANYARYYSNIKAELAAFEKSSSICISETPNTEMAGIIDYIE